MLPAALKAHLHRRYLRRFKRQFFAAISNLVAISWRFRGDLSQPNRRDFKYAQILRRFTDIFFRLRVTNRHDTATSLHRRFNTTKIAA